MLKFVMWLLQVYNLVVQALVFVVVKRNDLSSRQSDVVDSDVVDLAGPV